MLQLNCIKNTMKISRKTKTLKIVLDLFEKRDNAYSVVELVSIFSKKMNKTTVYRILDRLEDSGLLHSFLDKDGLKRYAKESSMINTSQKNTDHPHFVCDDCGISTCLPLEVNIPSIPNFKINNSEHLYTGQCHDCQA